MKKRVLFIASAGGHLSELMSLKSMMKDYDSLWNDGTSFSLSI